MKCEDVNERKEIKMDDFLRGYEQDQELDQLKDEYREHLRGCTGTEIIAKLNNLTNKTEEMDDLISELEKDLLIDIIRYIDATGVHDDRFRNSL